MRTTGASARAAFSTIGAASSPSPNVRLRIFLSP
jgi:hypothetical protein